MKRMTTVLIHLLLLLCIPMRTDASTPLVVDEAGLLTTAQVQQLDALAESIASDSGMDVAILTVNSLNGYSARTFADDYYDSHGYRYDGLILLLAIQDREWYISTSGKAIDAFTDYGLEQLEEKIVPSFSSGDFFRGFHTFLSEAQEYMQAYHCGNPIDVPARSFGSILTVSVVIGLAFAGISLLCMRGAMNTKRSQYSANEYMKDGSFSMPVRQDIFLYSNVSKMKRPENNGSGKGGSSVHTSSSGRSHGGGGGKF